MLHKECTDSSSVTNDHYKLKRIIKAKKIFPDLSVNSIFMNYKFSMTSITTISSYMPAV